MRINFTHWVVVLIINWMWVSHAQAQTAPTVSLTVSKASITEADQSIITATLSGPTDKDVVIDFKAGGSSSIYNDYDVQFSTKNSFTVIAGSNTIGSADGPSESASFNNPLGIAVDVAGNIYIADTYNNKIRKINPDGIVSTLAGTGGKGSTDGPGSSASFDSPSGLVLDAAGNLYIADAGNNKIRKVTPAGLVSTLAGNGTSGATDASGTAARFIIQKA